MTKPVARQSMRDRMREQAEKSQSHGPNYLKIPDGKKISFFQPKEGEFELDFIPYEVTIKDHPKGMRPGDLWPQKSIKVHYGIGAEERPYICPKTIGKKCPICETRAEMANDPNADEKLIKDLAPKERTLYQLYDLKDEKKGLQLWDYSYHLFEKRLLADINKTESGAGTRKRTSTPHGGFADLSGGQTLILSFIEKKMGSNKFYECDRVDAEDRDDYEDDVLEQALDLDSIIEVLDYDKLKALFLAIDEKDLEKDDDEPAPTRGRNKKQEEVEETAPTRRSRKEEPEEVPVRDRNKKQEEPEPTPTRGRRGAKEPEPEEEPEPTPTRGRRGASTTEEATPKCIAGGKFGVDADMHDACYDCNDETYAACVAKKNSK